MAQQGWIKLHRKIMDNTIIWETSEPYDRRSAWQYLLMMANHEDKDIRIDNNVITIRRGQHYTSMSKLAEKWHWSRNRVDRFLDLLNGAGMVYADRTPRGTLLTIVNYGIYQGECATNGAINETTNGATIEQPTEQPTEHKQEIKNIKNDIRSKEIIPAPPHGGGEWQ